MKIESITVKSIIVKSMLKHIDYVINPYVGCSFECQYCYACYMGAIV